MGSKQKVSYFYDPEVGQFYYGQGHPMKPHRVRMAHSLILHYGLYSQMQVYRPRKADADDMQRFHTSDYIDFLRNVNPDNMADYQRELKEFNMYEDCPVFDGLYNYCQITTGGSLGGAVKLNYRTADTVINWAGGLHHAKRGEASGFCYVNDIVLAALELLKYHQRVLYCDIDVHHGDGVEEAFLTTDRVMTVSFHKFGNNFFPGTGDIANKGHGKGRYYSLNVPLRDGITDEAYESIFKPVMSKVMEMYQPEAIILQCGSDSLAGDRLGPFNLSSKGHSDCVAFMRSFNLPMLVLGGGGYKIINVARCWAKETGVLLGTEMSEQLPPNEYYEYYGPAYQLTVQPRSGVDNQNNREYLQKLKMQIFEHLSHIPAVPGIAFHRRAPDTFQPEDLESINPQDECKKASRLWSSDLDASEDEEDQHRRQDHSFRNGDETMLDSCQQQQHPQNGTRIGPQTAAAEAAATVQQGMAANAALLATVQPSAV